MESNFIVKSLNDPNFLKWAKDNGKAQDTNSLIDYLHVKKSK